MSFYAGDSYTTITLGTGIDLTSATITRILYTKPNGLKGYWNATKSGQNLSYQLQNNDIDQHGRWQVQAYVEIGSSKAYGKVTQIHFEKPLNM